jgi:hypothetical protein
VRLRGIRAATFLHDTIMLRTTAVAHTITHRRMLARRTDNGKNIPGKKS